MYIITLISIFHNIRLWDLGNKDFLFDTRLHIILTYLYCSLLHLTHHHSHCDHHTHKNVEYNGACIGEGQCLYNLQHKFSVCQHQVLFQYYLYSDILHNWHLKRFARKLMKRECITQSEVAVYTFQLYLERNKCQEFKIVIIKYHVHCWK